MKDKINQCRLVANWKCNKVFVYNWLKRNPSFYDVLMSEAPRIDFNSVHAVITQDGRNPKLTLVATSWVKCGFNLLYNSFCSILGIIRKDLIPLSWQVLKAKCKGRLRRSKRASFIFSRVWIAFYGRSARGGYYPWRDCPRPGWYTVSYISI